MINSSLSGHLPRLLWLSGYYDIDHGTWHLGNGVTLPVDSPMWGPDQPQGATPDLVTIFWENNDGIHDIWDGELDIMALCEFGRRASEISGLKSRKTLWKTWVASYSSLLAAKT